MDGNAVTMEGGVLPAIPFPYESREGRAELGNHHRRGTPDSNFSMPPRHCPGHGGRTSPCLQRRYPTRHPSCIPPWRTGARLRGRRRHRQQITQCNKGHPHWSSSMVVTTLFTYLDRTQYSIFLSLHSLIVAVGCSHISTQRHKPGKERWPRRSALSFQMAVRRGQS